MIKKGKNVHTRITGNVSDELATSKFFSAYIDAPMNNHEEKIVKYHRYLNAFHPEYATAKNYIFSENIKSFLHEFAKSQFREKTIYVDVKMRNIGKIRQTVESEWEEKGR